MAIATGRDYFLACQVSNLFTDDHDEVIVELVLTWLMEKKDIDIHDEDEEYLSQMFLEEHSTTKEK